jgi:hypothetical protein
MVRFNKHLISRKIKQKNRFLKGIHKINWRDRKSIALTGQEKEYIRVKRQTRFYDLNEMLHVLDVAKSEDPKVASKIFSVIFDQNM